MNKTSLHLLIDLLASVALTVLVATGYMLWFVLPPGTNRTHELFGWMRHEWGELHFWIAVVLLAVLAMHVATHWRWLSMGLCKRLGMKALAERRPAAAGVIALFIGVAPLALVIAMAHLRVTPMETPQHAITETARDAVTPVEGVSAVTLERQVAQVLESRCASCHGAVNPAEGVRADTIAWLLIEQRGVRWVTPEDPAASPIFNVLRDESKGTRGARRHVVPTAELNLVSDWVRSLGQIAPRVP